MKCVHFYDNQIELAKEVIKNNVKYSNCELSEFEVPKNYLNNNDGLDISLVGYWHSGVYKCEMKAPNT